jgi:tRNA1Val (adenine37-N6)-methyltransferase
MKVGTDGVLLGAWCRLRPQGKSILDIGTGTGVIALQLAQRTKKANATIEAVESDEASAGQARRNFDASGWGSRLKLHESTVQEFATKTSSASFDHIVTNPPYFISSLPSPDASRNAARHSSSLPYNELIAACDRLLKPNGVISMILPSGTETDKMLLEAATKGFCISRRTEVWSTPTSGPKRLLLELARNASGAPESSQLVIEDAGPGTFSAEYRALTRDFYLYF